MRFHAPSLAVGIALALVVGVLSAQNLVNSPDLNVRVVEPAPVYAPAHPKNFVRLVEQTPFVVPSERVLVLTAVGVGKTASTSGSTRVEVNGVQEIMVSSSAGEWIRELPLPGLVAQPGDSVVVIAGANGDGRAWGYLADK